MINEEMGEEALRIARRVDQIDEVIGRSTVGASRHNAAVRGLAKGRRLGMSASPELIADVQAWIRGELTTEQVTQRVLERAREKGEMAE